jgi:branched-chain amino acid transport system permease protein
VLPETRIGWAGLGGTAVALALVPLFAGPYYVDLGTYAMIAAMLALSLQLLVGCTGLLSLGHGAFYGLAAYTVYLITPANAGLPVLVTLPAAVLAAGIAAFIVGMLSLRTRGFFFLMVTLAFGQMIFFVFHDTKIGGGTDGAYLPRPMLSLAGYAPAPALRPLATYYVGLLSLVLMYVGLAALLQSLFGRVLDGIRVNENRMQAIGFNTYRYKLAAFVIAGMLAGVAGHTWVLHRGFVNPELVGWHRSAEALLMILLGGLGTLHGPIMGALAFTGLAELPQLMAEWKPFARLLGAVGLPQAGALLQTLSERKLLVEGLVILAVVLALPSGLAGLRVPSEWRRLLEKRLNPTPSGGEGARHG